MILPFNPDPNMPHTKYARIKNGFLTVHAGNITMNVWANDFFTKVMASYPHLQQVVPYSFSSDEFYLDIEAWNNSMGISLNEIILFDGETFAKKWNADLTITFCELEAITELPNGVTFDEPEIEVPDPGTAFANLGRSVATVHCDDHEVIELIQALNDRAWLFSSVADMKSSLVKVIDSII